MCSARKLWTFDGHQLTVPQIMERTGHLEFFVRDSLKMGLHTTAELRARFDATSKNLNRKNTNSPWRLGGWNYGRR